MELAPRVDHIVLFSGDGDFRPLVESLQRQGVRVSVVSTIRSQPPMIADELRRQADNFIELDELRDVIGRPPREPRAIVGTRRSVGRGEVGTGRGLQAGPARCAGLIPARAIIGIATGRVAACAGSAGAILRASIDGRGPDDRRPP